jgi:hypothetical protein
MAELVTTATIRANDQLTGPLMAMANKVQAVQQKFKSTAGNMARTGASAAGAMAGAGFGIGSIVQSALEANRALMGIGFATVFDEVGKNPETAVVKSLAEIEKATLATIGLSQGLQVAPEGIAKTMEALIKAGTDAAHLNDVAKDVQILKLTDPKASIDDISAYASAVLGLGKSYKMLDGVAEKDYVHAALGSAAAVAAKTPLSTGSFIQGRRAFQSLASAAGTPNIDQDAMMGVLALRNISGEISGMTMRSNYTRVLSPTAPQQKAWNNSGLKRLDYMDASGADPTRISQGLRGMSFGRINGKVLQRFEKDISEAQKNGTFSSVEFQERMIARLNTVMGAKTEDDRDKNLDLWGAAALGGGIKFNMPKFLTDLANHPQGDDLAGRMLERQRHSANVALLSGYRPGEDGKTDIGKLREAAMNGAAAMDKVLQLHLSASASIPDRIEASMKLFQFRLANSPAMLEFLNVINGFADKLNKADPAIVNMATKLGLMAAVAAPLAIAGRGLVAVGAGGLLALRGIGWMAAWPFMTASVGLTSLGVAAGAGFGGAALGGFARFVGLLGKLAKFGAIGLVVGGVAAAFTDVKGTMQMFDDFKNLDSVKLLGASFGELGEAASNGLGKAAKYMADLLGMDTSKNSGLKYYIDTTVMSLKSFVDLMTAATKMISGDPLTKKDESAWGKGKDWLTEKADEQRRQLGLPALDNMGREYPTGAGVGGFAAPGLADASALKDLSLSDGSASTIGGQIAAAFKELVDRIQINNVVNVTVDGNGGGGVSGKMGGAATAPKNTTTNGQGYGSH